MAPNASSTSVQVTITNNNGSYTWGFTQNGTTLPDPTITIPGNTINFITFTLVPGNTADTVLFATPSLAWFNLGNPSQDINVPIPFTIAPPSSGNTGNTVVITDNNPSSPNNSNVCPNQGTYCFRINAIYNGVMLQSPDPTIINKDTSTGGF